MISVAAISRHRESPCAIMPWPNQGWRHWARTTRASSSVKGAGTGWSGRVASR